MRNGYSALLYCTMFLLCCANIICQRYCCMKTRYGFTVVALKVYVVLACIAVFSVSFQASGISARHRTEVAKRTLPPVPNSMLSPYAFARHPLPLRRNGKDFYVGLRRVRQLGISGNENYAGRKLPFQQHSEQNL